MNKLARQISVALLLAAPAASLALGLGEIEVKSNLNEPLRAEIELIYSSQAEAEATEAKLASAEDFARVGLDAGMITQPLQFAVGRNTQGRYVINVTTNVPVQDPFVDFLIEVNWANGRLLREYVLLLDPPLVAPSTTPVVSDDGGATQTQGAASSGPAQQPYSNRSSSTAAAAGASEGSYGPVQAGDTLWQIASDRLPNSDISVQQMMMLLLQLNPEAFQNNNINLLRRGAILRMPTQDDFSSYSEGQAQVDVRAQNQSWQDYVRSRTGSAPVVSDAGVTSDVSSTPPAVSASADSRLQLRPPSASSEDGELSTGGGANVGEVVELQSELAGAREDLLTSEAENAELRSRVGDLEALVERLRTLNVEDDQLAQLQSALADGADAAVQGTADSIDAAGEVIGDGFEAAGDAMGEGVDAAADLGGDVVDVTNELVDDAASAAGEVIGDVGDAAGDAAANVVDGVQEATADVVSGAGDAAGRAIDSIKTIQSPVQTDDGGILGLLKKYAPYIGGLLALLLAGGWFLRRRQQETEFAPGGSSLSFDPVDTELSDEEPVVEAAAEAVEELEAAFDESALIAAIDEQPGDGQQHLALLSSYYSAGEQDKFAVAAMRMQGEVDPDDATWSEVRSMGAKLLPDNPMFVETDDAFDSLEEIADDFSLDTDDSLSLDDDFNSATETVDAALDDASDELSLDLDLSNGDDELSLDLEMDNGGLNLADSEPVAEPELDLALDLDGAGDEVEAAVDDFTTQAEEALDLDLDLDETSTAAAEQIDEALADLDGLDLGGDDMLGGDDAISTKLDLAETYMRMGDPDGARGMLEEVVNDGNADQKARAKELLSELDF